jgi:ferric-dicitrate binding protein FerR (iron transport regulator)
VIERATPDDEALEAASRWVAVLKGGAPKPRDRRALRAWLAADIAHAAALDLMITCWDQVGIADPTPCGKLQRQAAVLGRIKARSALRP